MRITARLDFGGGDDPIRLGEIAWSDADRMAAIEWDPSFVAAPLPVSPFLVHEMSSLHHPEDRRAFDGLPALLGDSVPDGWGRMLMDREIERRKLMGPIALCRLAMVGRHGMGALTYQPADEASVADGLTLDRFSQEAREVEGGDDDALTRLRTISGGSQGARPKFVALLDRATGAIHDHRTPWREGLTHVLIKGRSREDMKHAVEIEATYCRVAERAGVELSPTDVLRSEKGEAFLVTERFDRDRSGRFHAQTAAALAECDYRRDVLDYAQLLKMTRVLTKDDAAVRAGLSARGVQCRHVEPRRPSEEPCLPYGSPRCLARRAGIRSYIRARLHRTARHDDRWQVARGPS